MRRVAAHLGLTRSDDELDAVAARCTFATMKAEAAARDAAAAAAREGAVRARTPPPRNRLATVVERRRPPKWAPSPRQFLRTLASTKRTRVGSLTTSHERIT